MKRKSKICESKERKLRSGGRRCIWLIKEKVNKDAKKEQESKNK